MKKVLSLLLLAFMPMLASMPVQAYDFENGGFRYNIVGNDYISVEVARNPSYSGDIVIPNSVYYDGNTYTVIGIGKMAFSDIVNIKSVTIPNSVTYIDQYAFEDGFMTSVTIGSGVKSIGMGAFQTCRNLSSITIPSSVTSIGSSAFKSCFKLKTIISERTNPIEIGDNVFSNYTTQATLIVPAGSKSAYQSKAAWNKFQDIVEFEKKRTIHVATAGTLPDLIKDYEKYYIEELTLTGELNGTDIKFIWDMSGTGWKYFTVSEGTPYFEVSTGGRLEVLDISDAKIVGGGSWYYTEDRGTKYSDYYTSNNCISYSMFRGCRKLKSIILPTSVTSIGDYAFSGTGWYNNQANGLLYLDKWLLGYKGNKPVGELKIREGTKGIASSAFCDCSGLTSVTIPNSVTSIGSDAFRWCSGLTSVTIPNSVTSIGGSAFSGCSGLTSVTIPNSVTSIGSSAFYGCSGLTSVTIGNSVTSIGYQAFYNCSGLTSVNIGNSVTSIDNFAFYGCRGLTSVTIPNSVTSIGYESFYDTGWYNNQANGLLYLDKWLLGYKGNKPVGELKIREGTKGIAGHAFSGCSGLTSVTIPNSVTSIGSEAFRNCSGLTSVTIPNSVTSIGSEAFRGCSGLTSITIPNSVTSIGDYAFSGCSGLTSIVSKIKKPFKIDGPFDNNIYASAKLTVPYGTKSLYESTEGWNKFQNIVEADPIDERVIYEKDFTGITEFTDWSQFGESQTDGKVGVDPNGVAITVGVQTGQVWQPQVMVIPDGSFNLESGGNYRAVITAKFPTDGTLQINMGSWSANGQDQFPVKSTGDFQEIVCDFDGECDFNGWPVNATGAHMLFQCGDFKGTTIVKKIQVIDMGDTVIPFSVDNICYKLYTKDKTAKVTINPQNYQGEVKIPSTIIYKGEKYAVTAIGRSAFQNCSGLTSITIPNSVMSTGTGAFANCSGLTSITMPNSVTSIGSYTFSGCNNLQFACISSEKFPISFSLGNNSCQYIIPQSAFNAGIPQTITNYATYTVAPKYITVKSTTATKATLELTPIDRTGGSTGGTPYEVTIYDLKPGSSVKGSWELGTKDRGLVSIPTVTTKNLVMNVQPAILLSKEKAGLTATVNEPDDDKHYGFEWQRNDAPSNMTPYQVNAQLYEGKIIGTLSGLDPDKYYKYRPFYKADDGTLFIGEWEAFITGDATVKFEPNVHTRESVVLPDGNIKLTLVLAEGTKTVLEKGFEVIIIVRQTAATRSDWSAEDENITRVVISGDGTSATVEGLEPGTEYAYRAYVKTESGTIYGEEKTFKTPLPGDANDNGVVDAADIVELVNAKAGHPSASFNLNNADANADGSFTEADITATANIIMKR